VNSFGCKKKEEKGKMIQWRVASGEWQVTSGEWLPYGIRRSTLAIRHLTPL